MSPIQLRMAPQKLPAIFATTRPLTLREGFNISLTQTAVVIRQEDGQRVPANLRS